MDALQAALDINRAELFFLLCLFGAWPLAWAHRELTRSATERHAFGLLVGVLFGWLVFGCVSTLFASVCCVWRD